MLNARGNTAVQLVNLPLHLFGSFHLFASMVWWFGGHVLLALSGYSEVSLLGVGFQPSFDVFKVLGVLIEVASALSIAKLMEGEGSKRRNGPWRPLQELCQSGPFVVHFGSSWILGTSALCNFLVDGSMLRLEVPGRVMQHGLSESTVAIVH